MKFLRNLVIFLALFSVSGVTSAVAQSVVLTNNTSYVVNRLYASSSSTSNWSTSPSDNLLAGQSVQPGQSVTINIPTGGGDGDAGDGCAYDLMAVLYGDTQFAYQYQVNVCDGGNWTITQAP